MVTIEFTQAKKHAIKKLNDACVANMVDMSLMPLLDLINNKKEFFTTSSCAGRIMVLELPELGDKLNARVLGKWHHIITEEVLRQALSKASKGMIWLYAQSPILHLAAASFEDANGLVKQAIAAGFKNSGMKTQGKQLFIEINSTERLDAPLGLNNCIYVTDEYISLIVTIANDIMEKSNEKLQRFIRILSSL